MYFSQLVSYFLKSRKLVHYIVQCLIYSTLTIFRSKSGTETDVIINYPDIVLSDLECLSGHRRR